MFSILPSLPAPGEPFNPVAAPVGSTASKLGGSVMNHGLRIGIITTLAAVVLLSGCAQPASQLNALDREAAAGDALPDGVVMGPLQGADLESVRLLADHEGIRYFVGQSSDAMVTCVNAFPDAQPDKWVTGCGGPLDPHRETVRVSMNGVVTVALVADGFDTSALVRDGLQPIHDNLLIAKP